MYEYAIGVDLGGTNLRAAAVDSNGQMIDRVSASVQYSAGRDVIISEIVTAIRAVRNKVDAAGLRGVGI
jgi:glucokinase